MEVKNERGGASLPIDVLLKSRREWRVKTLEGGLERRQSRVVPFADASVSVDAM